MIMFTTSCMQTFNSNTGDEGLQGNCVDVNSTELRAAYTVLKKDCMSCHTGDHSGWLTNCTNAAWIDSGQVVAKDTTNSNLLIRMKNFTPAGDMPTGAPAISDADYTILKTWIDSIP